MNVYKIANYISLFLGGIAIIFFLLALFAVFPQGYILAIAFSMPGMLAGLISIYMNMMHGFEKTIKSMGLWGMLISSIPVLAFMIITFIYKINH
jgi:hypothetical protein